MAEAAYYPAFLDLRGRRAVVLGGGAVASRKVAELVDSGAEVVVVAPEAEPAIAGLAARGRLEWRRREFRPDDLEGAFLLVAATDSRPLNAAAASAARRRGVLVNAVDDPNNCDLIAPAVVRRGDLTLAISTGGRSPAVARFVRERLEAVIGQEYGLLLEAAAQVRRELSARRARAAPERWQAALGRALAALRAGQPPGAVRERLAAELPGGEGSGSERAAEDTSPVSRLAEVLFRQALARCGGTVDLGLLGPAAYREEAAQVVRAIALGDGHGSPPLP